MVLKEIENRYSVRNFSDEMPSDESISQILEAGRLAPSWINIQPWHFIVIKNPEIKALLSQLSHGQPHVAQAPVVIACCGNLSAWDRENFAKTLAERPGLTEERINTLLNNPVYNPQLKGENAVICRTMEELTFAVAYMTLEAVNQGLGSCVIGALGNEITESLPELYAEVKEELNLGKNMVLMTLLPIGYPSSDSVKPAKTRKSHQQVVSYERL